VIHLLLVYDRSHGRLVREQSYADSQAALEERFAAERTHRGNPGIEVVVLTAESRDAIRRTHGRYFHSVSELASRP